MSMTKHRTTAAAAVSAVLLSCALMGCGKSEEKPYQVYQVTAHNPSTNSWVIDSFDIPGKTRVRFELTCDFTTMGDGAHRPIDKDPSSCSFVTGEKFAWNGLGRLKTDFVDVMMIGDSHMVITRGSASNRISQHFKVNSQHVVDYGAGP